MILILVNTYREEVYNMEMSYCRVCGSQNTKDELCVTCQSDPFSQSNYCHECGEETLEGQRVCKGCGVELLKRDKNFFIKFYNSENSVAEFIKLMTIILAITGMIVAVMQESWILFIIVLIAALILFGLAENIILASKNNRLLKELINRDI